ncbi:uncharacterized protein LOC129719520 isoform X2 [Wyeomyia smithii]|uniref:uncharacterized protein LOC129719520 isoform X2 n=1 Tax=Wyeomyia smithii TaxID=174621 RepID=UPI002467CBEB|nr:uncharacterized protein LOC129719520 isoform X2 [Wyeomyia smithii]
MAKTKWNILFVTFVLSCLSLATLIVSLCTPYWVVSEAYESRASKNSEIQYGLFTGSLTRNVLLSSAHYDLAVICLYEHNACVYSCQKEEAKRESELLDMMNGRTPAECPLVNTKLLSTSKSADAVTAVSSKAASKDDFINAVEPILSVFGLYIWNGIVIGATLMTMILWGALFGTQLSGNIGITDTLTPEAPYSSKGLAALGASYWILFIPMVFHGVNIGLLLWRQYQINKEPPPTTIGLDKSDLTIIMF